MSEGDRLAAIRKRWAKVTPGGYLMPGHVALDDIAYLIKLAEDNAAVAKHAADAATEAHVQLAAVEAERDRLAEHLSAALTGDLCPVAERDALKRSLEDRQADTEALWDAVGEDHGDLLDIVTALKARAEAAEADFAQLKNHTFKAIAALEAQVAELQRLGAEAGACITELLASVRMWRERSEALSALVELPDVSVREDASDAPRKPSSDNDSCRPSWAKDKS